MVRDGCNNATGSSWCCVCGEDDGSSVKTGYRYLIGRASLHGYEILLSVLVQRSDDESGTLRHRSFLAG